MRLGHALLDLPAQPRALWLLTRVADFLLKVHTGEWETYHPLRQRVYFGTSRAHPLDHQMAQEGFACITAGASFGRRIGTFSRFLN